MSFSVNAKEELIHLPMEKPCCMLAELAALTQTSASLGFRGAGRFSVTWRVESAALARRIFTCLKKSLGLAPSLEVVQHARLGGRTSCVLTLEDDDARKLLAALRMMEQQPDGNWSLKRTSPHLGLTRQCCRRSFLRGLFLGSGSISAPEKNYYLELMPGDDDAAQAALRLMEKCGVEAKCHQRKGRPVVYIKNVQGLEDLLTLMGASSAMLKLENLRITRQMRGNINRASNCDDHNYEKAVTAGEQQAERIKQIALKGGLSSLSLPLRQVAELRMAHPEASLTELGQLLTPPVGKSGVNHRLQRLMALADALEGPEEAAADEPQ